MQFLGKLAKFWLILVFAGSTAYFAFYNRERITVTLPPWIETFSIPAYAAYVAFFAAGAFCTSVYFGLDHVRKILEIRRLEKRLSQLEKEPVSRPTPAASVEARPFSEGPSIT